MIQGKKKSKTTPKEVTEIEGRSSAQEEVHEFEIGFVDSTVVP